MTPKPIHTHWSMPAMYMTAIYNAIADENMRDSLILKIEKELLKE